MDGGLKEESRIIRVRGDSEEDGAFGGWGVLDPGVIVCRTLNFDCEDWKLFRAELNWGTRSLYIDGRKAISSLLILDTISSP